jgi:putative oxidoreductase
MENVMLSVWTPKALASLRIMASLLFIEHGTRKLFGFPTPTHGMPPILSL